MLLRIICPVVSLLLCTAVVKADQFTWKRFEVAGHQAFTISPEKTSAKPTPWVLYAPTFHERLPNEQHEGWMFERFLAAGIAIAGVDVGESHGSPDGRQVYDALYEQLTQGDSPFSPKAALLARSRGGLMLYNWAADHPDRVACIAGIYPVCDLRSYPGLDKAAAAYRLTPAVLKRDLAQHNPVARLEPLAKANVPIFHIHGDKDKIVPLKTNSKAVAESYDRLGGQMKLVVAAGQWHNMWPGFFESQELVDFVVTHTTGQSHPKHLFILSGQSNMQGHRPDEAFTPAVSEALGAGRVLVVQDAMGGQPIRRWYKDWKYPDGSSPAKTGDLYDRLMKKVQTTIDDEELASVTFIWMQGERDANEKLGNVYSRSFHGLIEQLKHDLQLERINVVIGRLSDFDLANKRYRHWTLVRDTHVQLAKTMPHAAWVNTDDLNDGVNRRGKQISNDLHYSAQGYRTLGERFAAAAIKLIHED